MRCRLAYGSSDATATHCLLLHLNPNWFLSFWYQFTWVVWEKGPLNECLFFLSEVLVSNKLGLS